MASRRRTSLAADDRDSWLDLLLVSLVEPHLGHDAPTILHDYPPSQAALAIVRHGNAARCRTVRAVRARH